MYTFSYILLLMLYGYCLRLAVGGEGCGSAPTACLLTIQPLTYTQTKNKTNILLLQRIVLINHKRKYQTIIILHETKTYNSK